jgi:hypothetical protein
MQQEPKISNLLPYLQNNEFHKGHSTPFSLFLICIKNSLKKKNLVVSLVWDKGVKNKSEFKLAYFNDPELQIIVDNIKLVKFEIGAFLAQTRDGVGGLIEILEPFCSSKLEKKSFVLGVQICDALDLMVSFRGESQISASYFSHGHLRTPL